MDSQIPPSTAEVVNSLMERSAFGPLAAVFVLWAVAKGAEQVSTAPTEAFAGMDGLIPGHAWQGVAIEIHDQLKVALPSRG